MARDDFEDGPTDPNITLDPDARLTIHGEPTGDDLLAAVLADPDSDEPRLVYGDYLLERGDPRGEFIQLQLQRGRGGEPTARERELVSEHVAAWCDPLFEVLRPPSITFERGFLAGCDPLDQEMALRDLIGHPRWLTVEELGSHERALILHPCLRSLRRLRTSLDVVARLVHVTHVVRIEQVTVGSPVFLGGDSYDQVRHREVDPHWPEILEVGALTALRSLRLQGRFSIDDPLTHPFLASKLGRQLTSLDIGDRADASPAWDRAFRDHASLQELRLHPGQVRSSIPYLQPDRHCGVVTFEREVSGEPRLRLSVDHRPLNPTTLQHVRQLAGRFRVVWLEATPATEPVVVERLRAALRESFAEINLI